MKKRIVCLAIIGGLLTTSSCAFPFGTTKEDSAMIQQQWEEAASTPFGKYPEEVTYTLGKMSGVNNSNLPDGETYEDNAYTRYLKNMINIQNEDVFEALDEQYQTNVSMAITSGKIPDVMIVEKLEDLYQLVQADMIEDLTQTYEDCTSDRIKEIYESYGDQVFNDVTFDGKMMAIPGTNISDGPNLVWLRKDWLDELGLQPPKDLADLETILQAFVDQDPGGQENVGLVCNTDIIGECGYSSEYTTDTIFANFGSYPKQWIKDSEGNALYGSMTSETKDALVYMNQLYEKGLLDKDFLLRSTNNIIDLVVNGQCGAFFGNWWAPNNPLSDSVEADENADWQPYLLSTNKDGSTTYYSQNPTTQFVVVRKGYEHPEIVAKMISVLFDYQRYAEEDTSEFARYYQLNVDPTGRPLTVNVDYNEAISICYENLLAGLEGKTKEEDLELLEQSYFEQCFAYEADPENASTEDWAAYTSRITACATMKSHEVHEEKSLFFGTTQTMESTWWKLQELENETFLQIITGEAPVDSFDEFVVNWYQDGGAQITQEVNEEIKE